MRKSGSEAHDRVLAVLQENAASLLKLARRHSLCAEDAQDAYQRTLEIYLLRFDQIDEATAGEYLRTIVRNEAVQIRWQRQRTVPSQSIEFDEWESVETSTTEDRVLSFDRVTRAAEALQSCKQEEVAAMVLKADGHSYDEICEALGWSYTKVNRLLSEGRTRFLKRYAAIECGAECERLAPLLSVVVDGEASPAQMAQLRPHLRNCSACRACLRELTESQTAIGAVLPGVVILGGVGVPDGAAGLLARTYELIAGGVHDRLALIAMKANQAIEAMTSTKVVAAAASAAAVAGGGAVAVDKVLVEPDRARAKQRAERQAESARKPPVAKTAARPLSAPAPLARTAAPTRRQTEHKAPSNTPAKRKSASRPRPEFGFEGSGSAPTSAPRASAATTSITTATKPVATKQTSGPATDGGEDFGFER